MSGRVELAEFLEPSVFAVLKPLIDGLTSAVHDQASSQQTEPVSDTQASNTRPDDALDSSRGNTRIVMFPYPNGQPTRFDEEHICIPVPSTVLLDLRLPPPAVVPRQRHVVIAAMPETAVNENSDMCAPEHDVRASG